MKHAVGHNTNICSQSAIENLVTAAINICMMASSSSDKDEFSGFETKEADRARVLRRQLSDESDILVSTSNSESSSESKDEHEDVWTTHDSPVYVDDFVERTSPTSRIPEDGTALDFSSTLARRSLRKNC